MYGSNCKAAEDEGARVLHGCRRVFHNDKEVAFARIYETFKNVNTYCANFNIKLQREIFI